MKDTSLRWKVSGVYGKVFFHFTLDILVSELENSSSSYNLSFILLESVDCVNQEGQNYFLVGFNLKVEKSRGIRDDTAANDIKFVCRLLNQYRHYQLSGKGGPWGKWGDWSERCPMGSAVCGVQVRIFQFCCLVQINSKRKVFIPRPQTKCPDTIRITGQNARAPGT